MNLLFIGGAGFIGSSIVNRFMNSHYKIFVFEPSFADISRIRNSQVGVIRGLISDSALLEEVLIKYSIDKVIHLVSCLVPGSNFDDYKLEFETVIFPTVKLMQICSRNHIQFIYFSSGGTVYGDRLSLESFKETDPKEPISYYGLSKQMIENSIQFEHRVSDLQYLILRPSNPYGPGQNIHGKQGLISVSLGKVLSGESISIWGDGSSIRDYIYIEDLADIVYQLIEKNIKNTTLNIGSGKGYSVQQIVSLIQEIVDERVLIEYTQSRKVDVSNMILDKSLLESIVDIEYTSLKKGIFEFYNYVKNCLKNGLY